MYVCMYVHRLVNVDCGYLPNRDISWPTAISRRAHRYVPCSGVQVLLKEHQAFSRSVSYVQGACYNPAGYPLQSIGFTLLYILGPVGHLLQTVPSQGTWPSHYCKLHQCMHPLYMPCYLIELVIWSTGFDRVN